MPQGRKHATKATLSRATKHTKSHSQYGKRQAKSRPLMRKSERRKRQSTTAVPLTATIIIELPCPIVS